MEVDALKYTVFGTGIGLRFKGLKPFASLGRGFSILLFFAFFGLNVLGQVPVTIPAELKETAVPKLYSDEWYELNQSGNDVGVDVLSGVLSIKKGVRNSRTELSLPTGTLIGVTRGEWGGRLSFKPFDTAQAGIKIKEGNIDFIFPYQGRIYFLGGLAHLSSSEGALYELDTSNSQFSYKTVFDFEDAPEAFAIYRDSLFIATHGRFYVVKDSKMELVFKEVFWSGLYPNSIAVVDDANIFVGIRGGIVRLELTTRTIRFYKYKG